MKTNLNKLFLNSEWFLLFLLNPLYDILKDIILNNQSNKNMDWINSVIQIVLVFLLIFLSKSFVYFQFKMNVFNDVLKIRFKKNIFEDIAEVSKDLGEKIYLGELIDERNKARHFLQNKYSQKKGMEIDRILDEIYPEIKQLKK